MSKFFRVVKGGLRGVRRGLGLEADNFSYRWWFVSKTGNPVIAIVFNTEPSGAFTLLGAADQPV
jgi:hypothetical protein